MLITGYNEGPRTVNGFRPRRGLNYGGRRSYLGLTPQALCFRQLRWLASLIGFLTLFGASALVVFAQSNQNGASPPQSKSVVADPSKCAVIIAGASGEPAYAKQFQQWTASLRASLL